MPSYPVLDLTSAPEASKPALQSLFQAFGVIPNLAGVIAHSPSTVTGFVGLFTAVHNGTLSEVQIQVVLLTNAVTNRSAWPVAFHTTLALQAGVAPADVDAIRDRRLPAHPGHAVLSRTARALIEQRGHIDPAQSDGFVAAGFTADQLLEVVAIVAASTLTNYVATIARPELEPAFQPHAWS